uniref:Lymphotoxin-alpha n=1 Tax=Geotrypetes seraphini TaxID=260995 RepID=A0A6P8NLZ7_GEOSA|nr:lymphotoxin-alpha-like [Geotrypetes seraphini]
MESAHLYTPVTLQRDLEREPGLARSRAGGCRLLWGLCMLSLLVVAALLLLFHPRKQEESRDTLNEAEGTVEAAAGPFKALKFQADHDGKAAAHLEGELDTSGLLQWLDSTPHTFTQQGLRLDNNSLVIPATGLYFVYSQVLFMGSGCLENPIYLSHMVINFSTLYPKHVTLMSAQKSVCTDVSHGHHKRRSRNLWSKSIYQGALFALDKGDFLSTSTDGMNYLVLTSGTAFFGAFMV